MNVYKMMIWGLLIAPVLGQAHGLTEDRLHALQHAIAHAPENPATYVKRGRVYHDSEQWDKAIKDYTKALEIDPEFHDAMYWQAKALLQKGDLHHAEQILLKYLSHQPFSPAGHRALAQAFKQQQSYLVAAKHYDLAIDYDQNPSPQVYLERARTLLRLKPVPRERIQSGLVDAIQLQGEIITFFTLIIDLNISTENYPEAATWMAKLPEKLQNTPHWINKKAALKTVQGNHAQALALYQKNLENIASLTKYKQNLPAYVTARKLAEQGVRQLREMENNNHPE